MKITIDEIISMNKNEMPKRIKFKNDIFIYDNEENDYICEGDTASLFGDYIPDIYNLEDLKEVINQQVEILEEEKKIPKKIPYQFSLNYIYCNINETAKEEIDKTINYICDKINEIIDYLDYLKSKGDE